MFLKEKIKYQFCYINPYRQQYRIVDNNLYSYSPSPCPPMRTNDFKLKKLIYKTKSDSILSILSSPIAETFLITFFSVGAIQWCYH